MQTTSWFGSVLLSLAIVSACSSAAVPVPARLTGCTQPESVLYDGERDVYWVSNIGEGSPAAIDGNGFLSRIRPDGTIEHRFVEGLNGPKGMALVDDDLYVVDVDRDRVFDADDGSSRRDIPIAGAEFLNDVAAGPDGTLYVSDTAIAFGADGSISTSGNDAIVRIRPNAAPERWIESADLGQPNGLTIDGDALWLVTFGSGELVEIALADGAIRARHRAPGGGLDGIEPIGDRRFLISGWSESAIYRASAAGAFSVERQGLVSPADLGFDRERRRVLVPLLNGGEVTIDAVAE